MNSAWRILCPECVLEKDFEGFEADPDDTMPLVESIVSLGKSMGLDVSSRNVEELVDDYREELQDLQLEQQQCKVERVLWRNITLTKLLQATSPCSMTMPCPILGKS